MYNFVVMKIPKHWPEILDELKVGERRSVNAGQKSPIYKARTKIKAADEKLKETDPDTVVRRFSIRKGFVWRMN